MEQLSKRLKLRLSLPLPGVAAQLQMAHEERKLFFHTKVVPQDARLSSVMILIYQQDGQYFIPLIVRQQDGHVHGGQVSFPGGRFDEEDADLQTTALRELSEEIGVPAAEVKLLGRLTEFYIPPSNFLVHPFVGVHDDIPLFIPDEREVARVVPVCLDDLLDDRNISSREITLNNGLKIMAPAFCLEGLVVWGATAMILSELRTLLRELSE